MKTELWKKKKNEQPTQEKEKKKKKRIANPRKRKKKKTTNSQPRKRKKKVKNGQKLRLVLFAGPSCVFNYKNAIALWVMETELSFAKQPFCYGAHHFWIMSYGNRELSYENRQSKRPLSIKDIYSYSMGLSFDYEEHTLCLW